MGVLFKAVILLLLAVLQHQNVIKVNSVPALQLAVNAAKPGDRIIVTDGVHVALQNITISRQGTSDKPITIEAETTNGAEISGPGGFVIASPSSYIILKGFRITCKTGSCRVETGATHCTITRNLFECVPTELAGTKPYLNISGDDNEISYNTFQNKKDEGQMISVQGPGGDRMAKRTWIHHNYFNNFPPKANNCSAIQIGLSGRSMDSAFTLVEYNLFERTEGENEGAICHKSCNNIIRFNTFGVRSEECSIRHGNNSQVYGNFFINTTGLRFSGDNHIIYGNYFKNCKKAIVCTNGDGEVKEGSKLTCHDRADGVRIIGNIILDCASSYEMPDRKDGLGATKITFSDNLIRGGSPVSVKGSYPGAVWKGNIIWNTDGGDMPEEGYMKKEVSENDFKSMLVRDTKQYPIIPEDNHPMTINDVGQFGKK